MKAGVYHIPMTGSASHIHSDAAYPQIAGGSTG
jgi:hypothetical protein